MTLDDVPDKWHDAVADTLNEETEKITKRREPMYVDTSTIFTQ